MSVALTKVSQGDSGDAIEVVLQAVLSGTYASPGEPLDLRPYFPGNSVPLKVDIDGKAGYKYDYVPGTNLGNGRIRVGCATTTGSSIGLQEHANASYVAGVTGDVLRIAAKVQKFAAA